MSHKESNPFAHPSIIASMRKLALHDADSIQYSPQKIQQISVTLLLLQKEKMSDDNKRNITKSDIITID